MVLETYYENIRKLSVHKAGNYTDGMDLMQDVCERILTRRELLEHLPMIEQHKYVHQVINTVFIDRKRQETATRQNINGLLQAEESQPLDEKQYRKLYRLLHICRLNRPKQYMVIQLYYMQGFSIAEIATALNESPRTIWRRLYNGIKRMKNQA